MNEDDHELEPATLGRLLDAALKGYRAQVDADAVRAMYEDQVIPKKHVMPSLPPRTVYTSTGPQPPRTTPWGTAWGAQHMTGASPWDLGSSTVVTPMSGGTKNHPNAFRRKDGKTQCPDCHAVSLDAASLDTIPCTVPRGEKVAKKRPMERFHLSDTVPIEARLGDIWVDTSGTVRMLIAENGPKPVDLLESVGPQTIEMATWTPISSQQGGGDTIFPAHLNGEVNPEVEQILLNRHVGYLKEMPDTERGFYQQQMMTELLQYLAKHDLIAVTTPKFLMEEDKVMAGSARIGATCLARKRPSLPVSDGKRRRHA